MNREANDICTFDGKTVISDNLICEIPVSAIYSIFPDGTMSKEYTSSKMNAAFLANFLARKFGIDFDGRSMNPN